MSEPAVSIAVCTRDRAAKITEFLEVAAKISAERSWELVIVDNGSSDETPGVLARERATFPVPLTIVSDPTPGVARARNRGWQASTAPIVVFTNDDCYLPVDYVDRYAEAFEADERLGFVGGP